MSMLIHPARFASGLWTPAQLTAPPAMWLNEASALTLNSSGNAASWADTRGVAAGLGQVGSVLDPAIVASGQNGKRILSFNGSVPNVLGGLNNAFSLTNGIAGNVAALTIFVIGNPTKNSGTLQRLFYFSASNNGNTRAGLHLQSNSVYALQRRLDTDSAVNANTTQPDSNWHLYSSEHDWIGQTVAVRIDGGTSVSTSTGQGSTNTPNTASSEVCLMGSASTSGQYASGGIGEIIVLAYKPSTTDRQKIEGYAEWGWGTQANLPSGHPYKSAPP